MDVQQTLVIDEQPQLGVASPLENTDVDAFVLEGEPQEESNAEAETELIPVTVSFADEMAVNSSASRMFVQAAENNLSAAILLQSHFVNAQVSDGYNFRI